MLLRRVGGKCTRRKNGVDRRDEEAEVEVEVEADRQDRKPGGVRLYLLCLVKCACLPWGRFGGLMKRGSPLALG